MTPNQVTAMRVAAAFAAVGLFTFFGRVLAADFAAVALTIAAIALDGVDGYLARTRGMATPLGAQLDILGDRVVENLFFTFFAVAGLISLWLPILFFVRGTVIDFLRGLAARAGRNAFGNRSMQETWWGRALVASRASRAAYAILKCVCFCYLGLLVPVEHWHASWLDADAAFFAFADRGKFWLVRRGSSALCGRCPWCGRGDVILRWSSGDFLREMQRRSRGYDDWSRACIRKRRARSSMWMARCCRRPPLEWRFIGYLLERDEISSGHVGRWLARFAGGFWRDLHGSTVGNKRLSLRNQRRASERLGKIGGRRIFLPGVHWQFYDEALQRIVWHGAQGHRVFLVSGSLAPLARVVARNLAARVSSGSGGVRD